MSSCFLPWIFQSCQMYCSYYVWILKHTFFWSCSLICWKLFYKVQRQKRLKFIFQGAQGKISFFKVKLVSRWSFCSWWTATVELLTFWLQKILRGYIFVQQNTVPLTQVGKNVFSKLQTNSKNESKQLKHWEWEVLDSTIEYTFVPQPKWLFR